MNFRSVLFLIVLLCALSPFANAQAPRQPPGVWIAPESGLQPIALASLDIHVRMRGFVARTTLDLTFENPNARVLEGEFVFPLGAGQTIAGYALEVNGVLREGVVVDKQTARVAYESTVRQQIDPGLAELTAGNVFRTRLYPIPANGRKHVRLHIESTLSDSGSAWRYSLPMSFAEPVAHLHIRAESLLGTSAPLVDALAGDPALKFERADTAWVAELTRANVRPQKELAFRIPKVAGERSAQLEAVDVLDPAWRSVIAKVDSGMPKQAAASAKPARLALFFDASASARDRDLAREKAALGAYLQTLDATEVLLVAFRNDAGPVQKFRVRGDARAILDAIDALPLDGGSSYGAIDLKGLGFVDQVLIFGDGLSNFAGAEPRLVGDNGRAAPVFVLHAAQRADHARLARIARTGGGQLIDLTGNTPAQAVAALQQHPWRLLSTTVGNGECREISPASGARAGSSLTVFARCRGKADLTLSFGHGQGEEVVRTLAIGRDEAVSGGLADSVQRLWAQAWIDELRAAPKVDESAITRLAKRYSVVTANTSLLVLDRIEDYVRYRVEPKEAPLLAEYKRMLDSQPKVVADPGLAERLNALARRWHEFRDYHAANYPGIEAAIGPMADAELYAWGGSSDKARVAGRGEAQALKARAGDLAQRWLRDAAEPDSRATWEREAARIVFAIEGLRARREKLPASVEPPAKERAIANEMGSADGTAAASDAADESVASADPSSPDQRAMPRTEAEASRPMADREASPPPAAASPIAEGPRDAPASVPAPAGAMPQERARAGATGGERRDDSSVAGKPAEPAPALTASIELSSWNPDTPYLKAIRAARDPYVEYLGQREANAKAPSFYLDVADFLRTEAKLPRLALRVLSNLAELDTENIALTRVLAYRLGQWELHALAVPQFELALEQRGEEPQSYRDLALALSRSPQPAVARAVELLWHVASAQWDGRFPDIELIALHELNNVLAGAAKMSVDLQKIGLDERFLDPVAVGLRVVLSWDADNSDIDLWVVDPSGEKAIYSNPRTRNGGHLSRDFTGGYGPEVFTIRRPLPGTYVVHANYFGDRRQSLTGPVTIQLEFQTRFGSAEGKRAAVTRRLEGDSETIEIGRFKVGM